MNVDFDLTSFEKESDKSLSICAYLLKQRKTVYVVSVDFEAKTVTYKDDEGTLQKEDFINIYLCHCNRRRACGRKQ
jgi:hypothetical protein